MVSSTILGVDPGSKITGFCILRAGPGGSMSRFQVLDAGVIRPHSRLSHGERIGQIHSAIFKLIEEQRPSICVIERGFTSINHNTALKLGETRGAIISAARRCDIPLGDISPNEVKKIITGNGHSSKEAIARCLKALIQFDQGSLPFDVTDAVAIAMSYGMRHQVSQVNLNGARSALSPST